jgi:hypothetical protein
MKRISILISVILIFLIFELDAQPFEQLVAPIQGVGRSVVAWGDYDNDGDLDFVLCGITTSGTYLSKIYENGNGTFTVTDAVLPGVKDGSVSWGDFDNDNDLDILITGETENDGNIALIYRNDDGTFNEYDAGLPGVAYGDGVWGDYDNDGDLDILITGNWIVSLYENIDGVFILTQADFGQLQNSRATWGDFNNDGNLDILLTGDTGGGYFADIFLNQAGEFIQANLGITGLFSGSANLVDYDNDGDLDISITGFDIYLTPQFLTYDNMGDGTIAVHDNFMEGIAISSVDWGDYDNDGDLDILMCGKTAACGGSVSKVYSNDNGMFQMDPGASLQGAIRSNAAWADFDNDGDLDFILSGMTADEVPFTQLFLNMAGSNEFVVNTTPEAPEGLETIVDGQSVTFSWEKAGDAQTPQDGLYYNFRLGSYSGGCDKITPMAAEESGYRIIQSIGNTNMNNSWTISGLMPGTYYWSVQTIDQAYSGSGFSEEGTFMVVAADVNEFEEGIISNIFPNPVSDKVFLYSKTQDEFEISIISTSGQQIHHALISSGDPVDVSFLKEGIYFIKAREGAKTSVHRLVKR